MCVTYVPMYAYKTNRTVYTENDAYPLRAHLSFNPHYQRIYKRMHPIKVLVYY